MTSPSVPDPAEPKPAGRGPDALQAAFPNRILSLSSRAVHADDYINSHQAVAPPMHVSTTFRYSHDPDELRPGENTDPAAPFDAHIYSRISASNTTRLEALLNSLLNSTTISYSSGLSAFHGLLVFLNPRRIALFAGYHGCHGVIQLLSKLTGLQQLDLAKDEDVSQLQEGDVVHVETPVNPTGEARNLAFYRKLADEKGCYLTVDATFAPPPLLNPFDERWRADVVMHSGTKYFGGHSDMLCGVLAVHPGRDEWVDSLRRERMILGSVMGSLEGWLGVRSIRTLELRVKRQSESATKLVQWLAEGEGVLGEMIESVKHASVQKIEGDWLKEQMPNGFGAVFAVVLRKEEWARRLPSTLHLFHHATSLGGVESLIEWRTMTDERVHRRLLRVSVGVEAWEDLRDDLLQGFEALRKGATTS